MTDQTMLRVWSGSQHRLLVAVNVVAALGLLVAWLASADEADLAAQVRWLNLAIGAVVVGAGGDVLFLRAGRHAILLRQRAVVAGLTAPPARETLASGADAALVHVPGTERVHRAGCLLVSGKTTQTLQRNVALRRCEVCES